MISPTLTCKVFPFLQKTQLSYLQFSINSFQLLDTGILVFYMASHLVDCFLPRKPAFKCHHMCTACLNIFQKLRSHGPAALQPVTRLQCDRLSWMEALT